MCLLPLLCVCPCCSNVFEDVYQAVVYGIEEQLTGEQGPLLERRLLVIPRTLSCPSLQLQLVDVPAIDQNS